MRIRMSLCKLLGTFFAAGLCLCGGSASAQETISPADSLVLSAELYRSGYRFADAIKCYSKAAAICGDSAQTEDIARQIRSCRKAFELTQTACRPTVIARQTFSIDDFFLYYPLPDYAWRPVENAPAVYCPDLVDTLYVSHEAETGELYRYTGRDRMYFASANLPGMGGYDLFYCDWDPKAGCWKAPVNLGFPFNSPEDDILFMDTDDGRYSIFASNRDCTADSVRVYVLLREDNAPREIISNPEELSLVARLEPSSADLAGNTATGVTGETLHEDDQLALYQSKTDEVRVLREELSRFNGSEEQKAELTARLHEAGAELDRIEMYFLSSGAGDDLEKTVSEAGRQVESGGAYVFTRKSLGPKVTVIYKEEQ